MKVVTELPDVKDEDYLDSLLKSISNETNDNVEQESNESEDAVVSPEELSDLMAELDEINKEQKLDPSPIITPEEVARRALTEASEMDVKDLDADEISDNEPELYNEELDDHIDQMLEETDLKAVKEFKEAETDEDDTMEQLSPSELERLVNMNLDEIIEDAKSESVSVEELLDEAPVPESEKKFKADEKQIDQAEASLEKETEQAIKESGLDASELPEQEVDETSAAEALGFGVASTDEINTESNEIITDGKHPKAEKKTKKQTNKKKKGLLSIVKSILFESVDDEIPSEMQAANVTEVENELQDTNSASQENLMETGYGEEKESQSEDQSDKTMDENEKIIEEVYGGKEHVDEEEIQKKGFFARLKYKLEQRKRKTAEEEQLELEAEEQEELEKKQKKEEKKQADLEKKENKKKEKEAKPKKEKKPKEKKEKKVKEPPKPGDILKIKPISIVFFVLLIAGIIVLVQLLNYSIYYTSNVSSATTYYVSGDYERAYEKLNGISLSKKDQTLYDQSATLMYVQRQYDSYENYMKLNMKTEALNALIKGLERYNTYINEAKNLGVGDKMDAIRTNILDSLQNTFRLSESEVYNLLVMSKNDFTRYYNTIEAYGEVAQ